MEDLREDFVSTFMKLGGEARDSLASFVKSCAVNHGIVVTRYEDEDDEVGLNFADVPLFPSPIRRGHFELAQDVQRTYNLLYHRVAKDTVFLEETFVQIKHSDEFVRRLLEIDGLVRKESGAPRIRFEINRSDYLSQDDTRSLGTIKQVEINTIACATVIPGTLMRDVHSSALIKLGRGDLIKHMPESGSAIGMAENILTAWKLYGSTESIILFVVTPRECNIHRVRRMESDIYKMNSNISVKIVTLAQVYEAAQLTDDLKLVIDGREVAVVYFRTGYAPSHYPSEKEWDARLLMERSTAVKCPSVQYQLAGLKKVQQVLCKPGVTEKYIDDPDAVSQLRQTFAAQYSLEMEDGDHAIELAVNNPEKYVLKEQREAGVGNTFDEEIPKMLAKVQNTTERNNYILMERIRPIEHQGFFIRPNKPLLACKMVNEFGIFGCLISAVINSKMATPMFETGSEHGGKKYYDDLAQARAQSFEKCLLSYLGASDIGVV